MARDREVAPTPSPERTSARAPQHPDHPVLALQRAAGNRAVGSVLARKGSGDASPTVKIGKSTIPVSGGNLAAWTAKDVPDVLTVTSEKGDHSTELEDLSKQGKRIATITLTVPQAGGEGGQLDMGSLAFEISNGKVQGYAVDGSTESWRVVRFDKVHRTKTSHNVGQH
jgi:hypothetical protein